jgi:hypothetical protein
MKMWFGLQPSADAPVSWGARAIVDTRGGYATLDLLPDRQQFRGDEARIPALQAWLNTYALPGLRRRVARFDPELTDGRSRSIIVIEGNGWRLMASQQGSYGYLYLVAFPHILSSPGGEHFT